MSGSWVTVFEAVSSCSCNQRYADLKLSFFASILQFWYFRLAMIIQFKSLIKHFSNLHCWSWEVSVLEFTLVPNFFHSKLWSCVNQSFSMISPHSLMVHCGWMFIGAMQTQGIHMIFLSGRGRAYPCLMLPGTNFRSNSGWDMAPLWFPNLSTSRKSARRSSLLVGFVGHCGPFVRVSFMQGQRGWFPKSGTRVPFFWSLIHVPMKIFLVLWWLFRDQNWMTSLWENFSVLAKFILNLNMGVWVLCILIQQLIKQFASCLKARFQVQTRDQLFGLGINLQWRTLTGSKSALRHFAKHLRMDLLQWWWTSLPIEALTGLALIIVLQWWLVLLPFDALPGLALIDVLQWRLLILPFVTLPVLAWKMKMFDGWSGGPQGHFFI